MKSGKGNEIVIWLRHRSSLYDGEKRKNDIRLEKVDGVQQATGGGSCYLAFCIK